MLRPTKRSSQLITSLKTNGKSGIVLSFKVKAIIAIVIIAILIGSAFAVLLDDTPSDESEQQFLPLSNPTATPTPSPSAGSRQTETPRSNSYFGPISQSLLDLSPTPRPPGTIENAMPVNTTTWKTIATNAWAYFQPGIGVDSTTGLPGAGYGFPYFTDWDLGVYIQAVIDAQKTGLIGTNGSWGSYSRLEKVLTFLENRELNPSTHYPYWFYQASNGRNYHQQSDKSTIKVDVVDTGRLLIALNNLKNYNASWSLRIDNFVYNRLGNRSDYAAIVPDVAKDCGTSVSVYTYYYASGYASFWPIQVLPSIVLDNIAKAGNVTTNGVTLPKANILCEPLLSAIFQLPINPRINSLTKQVYLAHEAYYNETGKYVAFSEGNSDKGFIYEWVVMPSGATWQVTDVNWNPLDINPIIYNKVALSFLALYNTTYARDTAVYIERSFSPSTRGYNDGVGYSPDPNSREIVENVGSNTNGLILEAARYALKL